MARLEKSEALGRLIRQDDVPELHIPTFTLAIQAMQEGRLEEAKELIETGFEYVCTHQDLLLFRKRK